MVCKQLQMCIKFLQYTGTISFVDNLSSHYDTGGTGSTLLSRYAQETLLQADGMEDILEGTIAKEVKLTHVYSLYSHLQDKLRDEFDEIPSWAKQPLSV